MANINHVNTLLGMMIMMLLEHYNVLIQCLLWSKIKSTMSFMVKDKKLLKNYNKTWKKIESLMSINFDSKPTYGDDDKYIKTKTKTCEDSITPNFHTEKGSKKIS